MAVPKKRTGKSAQAKRRASWKATVPETTTCKQCGSTVLTHTVCPSCGGYKGKVVSIKNVSAAAEEVKVEEVKKTKKSTKKVDDTQASAKTKDVKTEETVEEVKKTKKSTKKVDDTVEKTEE